MAKKSKNSTAKASTSQSRRSRNELRQATARKRRNQNLMLIGGGAILVALIGLVVFTNIRSQQPVGTEESLPSLGNIHIDLESRSPITYNSTPPTSGPHYGGLARWAVHKDPLPYEQVLHNLEDGGVAIYYQCEEDCPELVSQLEEVVSPFIRADRNVLLVPNVPTWSLNGGAPWHKDMESQIALTAWQRVDKFDEFDAERVRSFIERYEGIDHHAR